MSDQKESREGQPTSKKRGRKIAFICFLAVFSVSAFMFLSEYIEKQKAEKSYSELRTLVSREQFEAASASASDDKTDASENAKGKKPTVLRQRTGMSFTALQKINPEIIGWLSADGTNIDYPVAHTDNNDYYLTHLYNGEQNANGTLFADYRNTGDFTDRNTVIYGHHMQSGAMFQSVTEYKNQDFYDVNPEMTLFTPKGDYKIELICGTVEDGNYQFVEFNFDSDEDFIDYVNGFREYSTFKSDVELQPGDRIVSLCTCSYEWENARYMLIGRLVPIMEEVPA